MHVKQNTYGPGRRATWPNSESDSRNNDEATASAEQSRIFLRRRVETGKRPYAAESDSRQAPVSGLSVTYCSDRELGRAQLNGTVHQPLPVATKDRTATNCRPLLVVHDAEEGHLVYDLRLANPETLELRPFRHPVVQPLHYRPLAVSGGTILGAPPPCEYQQENAGSPTIMVAVGDSMVITMDRVIHDRSTFEALRLLPGGTWHTVPLPRPPIRITSPYFVMGTRLWICLSDGNGTFSLDTEHGTWRVELDMLVPFEGRAFFVPELGVVVGLAEKNEHLRAYEVVDNGFHHLRVTDWSAPTLKECIDADHLPLDEMVSLAYLGNGRFCVCRGIQVQMERDRPPTWYMACSLLVLELARLRGGEFDGELDIVRYGRASYHGLWPRGQCRDLYLITT